MERAATAEQRAEEAERRAKVAEDEIAEMRRAVNLPGGLPGLQKATEGLICAQAGLVERAELAEQKLAAIRLMVGSVSSLSTAYPFARDIRHILDGEPVAWEAARRQEEALK